MKNTTFNTIQFTTAARNYAMECIAKLPARHRKYLEQALVHEYEETYSDNHQMLNLADVNRVLKVLKVKTK